jgi:hypothetical protein
MNLPLKSTVERRREYGKYIIRLQRRGAAFVYEVATKSGLSISAGFDFLSMNEEAALEGITDRLCGKVQGKAA